MPFLYALGGMLLTFAASMVGRVLLALGLNFVTYAGLDLAMTWVQNQIQSSIGGMPADIVNFLGWCWCDKAISMLFSTYTVCMTYKLAGSTVLKKLVMK